jgi:hypothetical protein
VNFVGLGLNAIPTVLYNIGLSWIELNYARRVVVALGSSAAPSNVTVEM